MKTLAEIAIEAGLVTKDSVVKAGRIAAARQQPLVYVLIRELGVDEVALIVALRKQTRVPLIDPADVEVDPEALRLVAKDVCARLRVLPLSLAQEGSTNVLRIAMADPTDTSAILELEQLAACEIEVTALPLSAIEELVEKGYHAFSTAITKRRDRLLGSKRPTRNGIRPADPAPRPTTGSAGTQGDPGTSPRDEAGGVIDSEPEVSVTTRIPTPATRPPADLEDRFAALCQLLVAKGLVTEAELSEVVAKLRPKSSDSS